jgi:hypothetical protein
VVNAPVREAAASTVIVPEIAGLADVVRADGAALVVDEPPVECFDDEQPASRGTASRATAVIDTTIRRW